MAKTAALIQGAIASAIAQACTHLDPDSEFTPIEHTVISIMSGRVVQERADLLVKGIDLISDIEKQFNTVNKPDNVLTTIDGQAQGFFTAKRTQEIAAAKKKLDRANEALGLALNSAQFGALEKLVRSGGKGEE